MLLILLAAYTFYNLGPIFWLGILLLDVEIPFGREEFSFSFRKPRGW